MSNPFSTTFRRLKEVALIALAFGVPLALSPLSTDSARPKEALFRALAAIAAAGFTGERLARGERPRLPFGADLAALGALLCIAALSLARTRLHPFAVEGGIHLLCGACVFVAAADPERDGRLGSAVRVSWLLATSIAAIYGLAQACGIDVLRWSGPADEASRVRSTFGHHSFAAMFFAASIPIAISEAVKAAAVAARVLAAAAGLLAFAALVLTYGRAGYVGLFAGLAVIAVFGRRREGGRRASLTAAVALVALVGVLTIVPSLRGRLLESVDPQSPPVATRLLIWRDSLKVVAEHPLAGAGIGLYDVALTAHLSKETTRAAPPSRFVIGHAHLEPLEVLVELGALGCIAFLVFVGAALARILGPRTHPDLIAVGLAAAAVAVAVTNLFDVNLRSAAGALPFYLALGLGRARSR